MERGGNTKRAKLTMGARRESHTPMHNTTYSGLLLFPDDVWASILIFLTTNDKRRLLGASMTIRRLLIPMGTLFLHWDSMKPCVQDWLDGVANRCTHLRVDPARCHVLVDALERVKAPVLRHLTVVGNIGQAPSFRRLGVGIRLPSLQSIAFEQLTVRVSYIFKNKFGNRIRQVSYEQNALHVLQVYRNRGMRVHAKQIHFLGEVDIDDLVHVAQQFRECLGSVDTLKVQNFNCSLADHVARGIKRISSLWPRCHKLSTDAWYAVLHPEFPVFDALELQNYVVHTGVLVTFANLPPIPTPYVPNDDHKLTNTVLSLDLNVQPSDAASYMVGGVPLDFFKTILLRMPDLTTLYIAGFGWEEIETRGVELAKVMSARQLHTVHLGYNFDYMVLRECSDDATFRGAWWLIPHDIKHLDCLKAECPEELGTEVFPALETFHVHGWLFLNDTLPRMPALVRANLDMYQNEEQDEAEVYDDLVEQLETLTRAAPSLQGQNLHVQYRSHVMEEDGSLFNDTWQQQMKMRASSTDSSHPVIQDGWLDTNTHTSDHNWHVEWERGQT